LCFWNKLMRAQGALINALDEISIMNTKGVRW